MHVFCTFGADLYAQSVLFSKISASELSRKFIKTALLVGKEDASLLAGLMRCKNNSEAHLSCANGCGWG